MGLSSLGSLQITIRQLKEIIAGIKGEEHESCRLAGQMEALAAEIERKSGSAGATFMSQDTLTSTSNVRFQGSENLTLAGS